MLLVRASLKALMEEHQPDDRELAAKAVTMASWVLNQLFGFRPLMPGTVSENYHEDMRLALATCLEEQVEAVKIVARDPRAGCQRRALAPSRRTFRSAYEQKLQPSLPQSVFPAMEGAVRDAMRGAIKSCSLFKDPNALIDRLSPAASQMIGDLLDLVLYAALTAQPRLYQRVPPLLYYLLQTVPCCLFEKPQPGVWVLEHAPSSAAAQ